MTYKFDEEPTLGGVVKSMKPFCKLTKQMDVPDEKYIVGDFANPYLYHGLAGRKWSRLCGFTFISNDGRVFQFVFVPKLRGSITRNNKALSGWYCWSLPNDNFDNKEVTSISTMKSRYGFDINKFVHSDVFDKYIKLFQQNVSYALEHQVKELLAKPPTSQDNYKEIVRHVNAIKDSIAKIGEVKQYVTPETKYNDDNVPEYAKGSAPKVGHAKIAYNADKTYDLRNIDKEAAKKQAIKNFAKKIH